MVFGPIAFKTRLGQAWYYPFGPFCYLNEGCNPKIANVKGVVSRVCVKTGSKASVCVIALLVSGCLGTDSYNVIGADY